MQVLYFVENNITYIESNTIYIYTKLYLYRPISNYYVILTCRLILIYIYHMICQEIVCNMIWKQDIVVTKKLPFYLNANT